MVAVEGVVLRFWGEPGGVGATFPSFDASFEKGYCIPAMADDPDLRPVFVPPLDQLLIQAETQKGSALTESEILRTRNEGACIMMSSKVMQQMEQARGYRDIRPENCLAEWHRRRGEAGGLGYLPKLILCLPGGERFKTECEPYLLAAGIEHEFRGHEPRLSEAFRAAHCRIRPSLHETDYEAISQHSTVLYLVSESLTPSKAGEVPHEFLRMGRQLLEDGAIAVKCESSGIAHSGSRWWEWTAQCDTDPERGLEYWRALYCAYVRLPLQSETDLYSCGMHLLGQPDMIVSTELLDESAGDDELAAQQAVTLFNAFGLYLLAEVDSRGFVSGHTFSASAEAPRYRIVWEPCDGYEEDEFFFNPYGRWRFVRP